MCYKLLAVPFKPWQIIYLCDINFFNSVFSKDSIIINFFLPHGPLRECQSLTLIRRFLRPAFAERHGVRVFPRAFPLISGKTPPTLHPRRLLAFLGSQDLVALSVQLTKSMAGLLLCPSPLAFIPARPVSHFHFVKSTRNTTVIQSAGWRGTNWLFSPILTVFVRGPALANLIIARNFYRERLLFEAASSLL